MIYVSQGHEHSVGPEIFFKSALMLNQDELDNITFVCNSKSMTSTLDSLHIEHEITNNYIRISKKIVNCLFIQDNEQPESTTSLREILKIIKKTDLLLTLPTSKDQLIDKDILQLGHTEFFRNYYDLPDIGMCFYSDVDKILLITDHIPVSEIGKKLNSSLVINKVSTTIDYFNRFLSPLENIYISGINPHSGENGLLGTEDSIILESISCLKKEFPSISFSGPVPADTMHFNRNNNNDLLVYMYHDQALPWFKSRNGLIGINISIGLPFLRLSVDHGTAFSIFKKNIANYSGCLYVLKKALEINTLGSING